MRPRVFWVALADAAWWASVAALVLWWTPAILAELALLLLDRARFRLALGLGRALLAAGLRDAARAVFAAEAERAGRRLREIRERRGW